jgi:hypothetical protein
MLCSRQTYTASSSLPYPKLRTAPSTLPPDTTIPALAGNISAAMPRRHYRMRLVKAAMSTNVNIFEALTSHRFAPR